MIYIMSPEELENLPNGTVVWEERREYDNTNAAKARIQPMMMYNGMISNYYNYIYPDELRSMDDIQLRFRYWSMRPTIFRMDHTPWTINEDWRQ